MLAPHISREKLVHSSQFGYSRDGKKGKLQIIFGLLCNAQGCPVAVEVFEGNIADSTTLATQLELYLQIDAQLLKIEFNPNCQKLK